MLKLVLVLQFIVTNAYFSVACNTKVSVIATLTLISVFQINRAKKYTMVGSSNPTYHKRFDNNSACDNKKPLMLLNWEAQAQCFSQTVLYYMMMVAA